MSKQIKNLINIIEKSDSTIDYCIKEIQEIILSDKSLHFILNKMATKINGVEKKNFNIWLRNNADYEFTLEVSSKYKNEIEVIYFRIQEDLTITDYNYKYEFQDMNKFSNDLRDLMKTYFE